MTSSWIFLVSFFAIIAGCAIGMTLRVPLPKGYLAAENREMIRLCASLLVADLSRPFIGLMQLPKEQLKHTLVPLNRLRRSELVARLRSSRWCADGPSTSLHLFRGSDWSRSSRAWQ